MIEDVSSPEGEWVDQSPQSMLLRRVVLVWTGIEARIQFQISSKNWRMFCRKCDMFSEVVLRFVFVGISEDVL